MDDLLSAQLGDVRQQSPLTGFRRMPLLPRAIRVLLAVGSPVLLRLLKDLIRIDSELDVVGDATESGQLLDEVRRLAPDVVVISFGLPGGALAAARLIRSQHPATTIVLLSDGTADEYRRAALEVGASACIATLAAFPALTETIKQLSPP